MVNRIKWQLLIAIAGFGAIVLLLNAFAVPVVAKNVPARGGTLVEGVAGTPRTINPLLATTDVDRDISSLVFSGLTKSNSDGAVLPDLAKSWDMSEDGRTWTFHLRDDVLWQDGAPFTADDVVYTISTIQNSDFPDSTGIADLWRSVTLEKTGTYEIKVTLPETYTPFLNYTTIGILPQHLLKDVAPADLASNTFNTSPIGTGPFRLDPGNISARAATLEYDEHYYGGRPYLDSIRFQFYPNYDAAITALEQGEVQTVSYVPPQQAFTLKDSTNLRVFSAQLSNFTAMFLNLKQPIFEDKAVRQAMAYGINKEYLVQRLLFDQATVADSPIQPDSWAYKKNIKQYEYDPAKAKSMLDEAGWVDSDGDGVREKDGHRLEFTITTNDQQERAAIAVEIADQLNKLGMKVTVESKSVTKLLEENLAPRSFDAVVFGWRGLPNDPDCYNMWHSSQVAAGFNFSGFENEQVDKDLEAARAA